MFFNNIINLVFSFIALYGLNSGQLIIIIFMLNDGAARLPISSRCYSSSPDLWMRRAYNGYMYGQGNTRGGAMDKIHPDDIVRIEFDGKAGTLSYSLNGSEPEIGFTDITGNFTD